jgi:uncharacterized membrane protein
MSNLVIGIFENTSEAELARRHLLEKDSNGALSLEDIITAERTETGKVRFRHVTYFILAKAIGGAFLGLLFGFLLLNPVFAIAGFFLGLITGFVYGTSSPIGINPEEVRSQAQDLNPGQAALFVRPERNPAQIAEEIYRSKGATRETSICDLEGGVAQCRPWSPLQPGLVFP